MNLCNHHFLTIFVCLLLLIQFVVFVFSDKQPLSATNFLYELDKITQEIVTVSCFQTAYNYFHRYVPLPSFETSSLFTSWRGWGGGELLPEKLVVGMRPASQNPYSIYDQNLRHSQPYL